VSDLSAAGISQLLGDASRELGMADGTLQQAVSCLERAHGLVMTCRAAGLKTDGTAVLVANLRQIANTLDNQLTGIRACGVTVSQL
jgi:hypothetical protein